MEFVLTFSPRLSSCQERQTFQAAEFAPLSILHNTYQQFLFYPASRIRDKEAVMTTALSRQLLFDPLTA
jgi:hypothetical protein